ASGDASLDVAARTQAGVVRMALNELAVLRRANRVADPPGPTLSAREREVLQLLTTGLSNQQLAARLHVSLSTIKTHLNHIFDKLGVRRRTHAVARARELGLS
ncbi:MAG: response regulator transcription factor, partial [Myxococcota bacterium]